MGGTNDTDKQNAVYPEIRDLDGCYFRVERNGKWKNICFSDLTEQERSKVIAGRSEQWLSSLVEHLATRLRAIGDQLDIYMADEEE